MLLLEGLRLMGVGMFVVFCFLVLLVVGHEGVGARVRALCLPLPRAASPLLLQRAKPNKPYRDCHRSCRGQGTHERLRKGIDPWLKNLSK